MRRLRQGFRVAVLVAVYLDELVRATVEVVRMVITPGLAEAVVLAVDLRTDRPWVITTIANLYSLTPGSLTLDVDAQRSQLYVHALTTRPVEELREDLVRLQDRVLEVAS